MNRDVHFGVSGLTLALLTNELEVEVQSIGQEPLLQSRPTG